jgi:hypothetical protein
MAMTPSLYLPRSKGLAQFKVVPDFQYAFKTKQTFQFLLKTLQKHMDLLKAASHKQLAKL